MPLALSRTFNQHRKLIIYLVGLYIVGALFFMYTNPAELPLLVLIVPFIYIFGVLCLTILLICRILRVKSALFVSLVVSVFGVLLFILGSLHQLTLRDVI